MRQGTMAFVALTLMGAVRSIRQDMSLLDQISMIQLPLHEGIQGPSPVAGLKDTLPTTCKWLAWATPADCDLSMKIVDFIIAQNGGPTGNDMNVAKRVANLDILVYGPPGAVLTAYDLDSNGNFTLEEIRPVIQGDEGMGLPQSSLTSAVALLDSNSDGTVVMPEVYQFGRACLVIRQFLRDIDLIAPTVDSVDLLPALDTNLVHLPDSSPSNLKWHEQFQVLAANFTAECHAVDWATEEDCKNARSLLNTLVNIPTWNTSDTLVTAQALIPLKLLLHIPDQYAFGLLDPDGNRAFTHQEFMSDTAGSSASVGAAFMEPFFAIMDLDGNQNVTREEVYAFVRSGLVLRHFYPELDPVSPGRLKDGTPKLLDETALTMALHLIDPPPLPRAKLASGPKLLSVFGIMVAAFIIQWFFCAARVKSIEADDEKDVK